MSHTEPQTEQAKSTPPHTPSSTSSEDVPDIERLKSEVQTTNTLSAHIILITALREAADLTELRKAIQSANSLYPLPQTTWVDYLTDESALATTPEARQTLLTLHTRALSDFSTPLLHARRLVLASSLLPEIGIDAYKAFVDDAREHGAGYDPTFKSLCATLPHMDNVFQETPDEVHVFEEKLSGTPPAEAGRADDSRVTAYLSFVGFAEVYPRFAISVYERALSEAFFSPVLWKEYDNFLSRALPSHRKQVLKRACRVLPEELFLWSRAVTIADSPGLIALLDDVRPFVMRSEDLLSACVLSKMVWTRYLALGCPAEAREKVGGSLEFNLPESVEWASASMHAAGVLMISGESDAAIKLMEDVVTVRPEARWWLAYAGLVDPEKRRTIYERGTRSVAIAELHVLRDAWELFEVSQRGEGVMQRLQAVADVAAMREAERGKAPVERERRHGKPAKRRRAERPIDALRAFEAAMRVASSAFDKEQFKAQNGGVDKMEEEKADVSKDKSTTKDGGKGGKTENTGEKKADVGAVEPKTIFLNNLPFAVTEDDLQEMFSFAGGIKEIRLPRRSDGATKGIAYIEFEDEEAVPKALTKHNNPIKGRAIWVRQSKPPLRGGKAARRGVPMRPLSSGSGGDRAPRRSVTPSRRRGRPKAARRGAPVFGGTRRAVIDLTGDTDEDEDGDKDIVMQDHAGGLGQDDFRKMLSK